VPELGAVQTVRGPVPAAELGTTLPHEHLFIDLTCYWAPNGNDPDGEASIELPLLGLLRSRPFAIRANCLLDEPEVALTELEQFSRLGGGAIVDVTPSDIGRDPHALLELSRASGLHIIAGCGHYVHIAHPASLPTESVEQITDRLLIELTEGIGGTNIRPGVIGEIGTSAQLHPDEAKTLRATARAQAAVGLPITLHLHPTARTGHAVLDILESEGADLSRVVAGHLDDDIGQLGTSTEEVLDYHCSLADRGCFIQYDTCGNDAYYPRTDYSPSYWLPSDRERIAAILQLLERGYETHLLLSQDVCKKTQLIRYGGLGYAHILRTFANQLQEADVPPALITQILTDNPQRMLAGKVAVPATAEVAHGPQTLPG
jgi:phosphotriesterase-related protein